MTKKKSKASKVMSKLAKGLSRKIQGKKPATGSKGRSIGSEYAYAVKDAMKSGQKLSQSAKKSFLGTSRKSLKGDSLVKSDKLTKTKSKKARSKKV